jgi:hypothetical protein
MLLIANPLNRDETATLQPLQLSLDGARAGLDGPYDLGGVKAPLWLAEDEAKHALLHIRK